jgi:flavin reductase (DIM6/NTAB) family NADH-FMN oxidoreductase RutF
MNSPVFYPARMGTEDTFHDLVSGTDYPMFIVTATSGGERAGCLVGFVTQASIRPARLIVMLSKANHTYRVAQRADRLVVHFLHQGNHDLAALFGEQTSDKVDKFAACDWREGPARETVLPGTRGWLTGTILGRYDAGDHVAHLIDVTAARTDAPGPQLAFQSVTDLQPGHPA